MAAQTQTRTIGHQPRLEPSVPCGECNIHVAPHDPEKVQFHGMTYHGPCFKTWLRRVPLAKPGRPN